MSGVHLAFERPPWHVVLSYELKLRTKTVKLVVEATGCVTRCKLSTQDVFEKDLLFHAFGIEHSQHASALSEERAATRDFPGKGKAWKRFHHHRIPHVSRNTQHRSMRIRRRPSAELATGNILLGSEHRHSPVECVRLP